MAAGTIHNTFMVVLWSFCTSADVTTDLNAPTDMNSHGPYPLAHHSYSSAKFGRLYADLDPLPPLKFTERMNFSIYKGFMLQV